MKAVYLCQELGQQLNPSSLCRSERLIIINILKETKLFIYLKTNWLQFKLIYQQRDLEFEHHHKRNGILAAWFEPFINKSRFKIL
jgi:hypothetical protein